VLLLLCSSFYVARMDGKGVAVGPRVHYSRAVFACSGGGNVERPLPTQRRNVTRRTTTLLSPTPEQLFALRPCRISRPFRLDARGSVVRA